MPKYTCTNMRCGNVTVVPAFYTSLTCLLCHGLMKPEGIGAPSMPAGASVKPTVHPSYSATHGPRWEAPVRGVAKSPSVAPVPQVDMGALSSAIAQRKARVQNSAVVNQTLQYVMMSSIGGISTSTPYNFPLKYQLWKTDISRQSPEITIKIPLKVYSGAAGLAHWRSRGYTEDQFRRTIHPLPGKTSPELGVQPASFSATVRDGWSAKINSCWGKVGVIHLPPGGKETIYSLKFEFLFVDDPAEAAASVVCVSTTAGARTVNPTGTIDAIRWGVDDIDPSTFGPICHEVGHLIGNPDEYDTITYAGKTINWGAGYTRTGIMNNPDSVPLIRYYKHLALELASAFNIPLTEASLIENVAMASSGKRHKLSDHMWS